MNLLNPATWLLRWGMCCRPGREICAFAMFHVCPRALLCRTKLSVTNAAHWVLTACDYRQGSLLLVGTRKGLEMIIISFLKWLWKHWGLLFPVLGNKKSLCFSFVLSSQLFCCLCWIFVAHPESFIFCGVREDVKKRSGEGRTEW